MDSQKCCKNVSVDGNVVIHFEETEKGSGINVEKGLRVDRSVEDCTPIVEKSL